MYEVATGNSKSEEWIKENVLAWFSKALFKRENVVLWKDEPIKTPQGMDVLHVLSY